MQRSDKIEFAAVSSSILYLYAWAVQDNNQKKIINKSENKKKAVQFNDMPRNLKLFFLFYGTKIARQSSLSWVELQTKVLSVRNISF